MLKQIFVLLHKDFFFKTNGIFSKSKRVYQCSWIIRKDEMKLIFLEQLSVTYVPGIWVMLRLVFTLALGRLSLNKEIKTQHMCISFKCAQLVWRVAKSPPEPTSEDPWNQHFLSSVMPLPLYPACKKLLTLRCNFKAHCPITSQVLAWFLCVHVCKASSHSC